MKTFSSKVVKQSMSCEITEKYMTESVFFHLK